MFIFANFVATAGHSFSFTRKKLTISRQQSSLTQRGSTGNADFRAADLIILFKMLSFPVFEHSLWFSEGGMSSIIASFRTNEYTLPTF
jgi:hypothetical protein